LKVDRQHDTYGKQTYDGSVEDEISLEGQILDCIFSTLPLDVLISAKKKFHSSKYAMRDYM
jgi:hypothetical protein